MATCVSGGCTGSKPENCDCETRDTDGQQPSGCNADCYYCSGGGCTHLTSGTGSGCSGGTGGCDHCHSDGSCVNTNNNHEHCGSCNHPCDAGVQCIGGQCH